MEKEKDDFIRVKVDGESKLATPNLIPGNRVYKERLVNVEKQEFRVWDAFRSKLGAAIMNGLSVFPITYGSRILYLGVSTGTTVSHISDIVGKKGVVFGVEHSSRVAREFLNKVASYRENIVPILQDARNPKNYFGIYGKVDIVYVDIAQYDQTEIAILNCKIYLKNNGYLVLAVKARSIDVTKNPRAVAQQEAKKLEKDFEVIQLVDLHPYDKDHTLILARFKGS